MSIFLIMPPRLISLLSISLLTLVNKALITAARVFGALIIGGLLGQFNISYAYESPVRITNTDSDDIEKITIFYAKDSRIKQTLTSDNTYLNPQKIVHNNTSVADIILVNPGSDLNGQGGLFQSYNIRGFSRNRIKTEVDGIPIITDRRAGNALSFIPSEMISGVNIQKGPSATLYGTGAMGGVVSVSTFNDDTSELNVLLQPQDNSKEIHIKHADDNWSIGALHRKASNANAADGTPLKTEYKQSFLTLAKQAQWNEIDVYLSLIANQGTDLGKSSAKYPDQRISLYPKDNHFLAQMELSYATDWSLKLYHHNQDWQSETSRLDNQQNVSRTNLSDYQSDTWGSYGQYQYQSTRIGLEWLARRNIKISEQEFNSNNELQWQNQSINAQEDNLSAFIFQQWEYKKLAVEAGIRYDWIQVEQENINVQSNNDDHISYSLNSTYQLTNNTTLNAELATSFRFPSVSELFYNGETPRGNTQGNPDLSPEESLGYQVSINHELTASLSLTLNTYYYQIDDYIERYTLTNTTSNTTSSNTVKSYRNSEQVSIKGLELISRWHASQRLSTQLGLQLQSGEDKENNAVDDSLPNAIKWSLYWQPEILNQSLILNNNITYQFSKHDVGPSEAPMRDELIWNVSLTASPTDEQTVTLSLLNITDNNYKASADEDAPLQAECTWNIKWTYSF